MAQSRLKIFTWHIHGSYLFYLSQGNYDVYIPTKPEKTEGYYGRGETFPFGPNVIEVPAEEVKNHEFDVIVYQTNQNYLYDQYEILSAEQQALPKVYIEHDPPRQHPTDTKHAVNDKDVTLVHVTHFNKLMWDCGETPATVIEHGVINPNAPYTGEKPRGIVVINNLPTRGRLLGLDIFMKVREHVPLDLVGMGTGDLGLGEVLHPQLPEFVSKYRFFFNPIRYTSLGLAVCEALMQGIPVVGLATTELSAVIDNEHSGFIHTDVNYLIDKMNLLIEDADLARRIGAGGRELAQTRFSIERFTRDWEQLFNKVTAQNTSPIYIA
ncbi:glycosyltransferase family 4 protein [Mucilaginibacter lacusdianchii]|uniref:glycosyltransferase family 4 protein n=1 Tax=Mucilaginibacter lacusdianchii TaxID=2684211 RepID=UPI00131CBD39|nr:glycosyltransferase family 4 protein [Mucilaginibacter sp. JXJ CY 39]